MACSAHHQSSLYKNSNGVESQPRNRVGGSEGSHEEMVMKRSSIPVYALLVTVFVFLVLSSSRPSSAFNFNFWKKPTSIVLQEAHEENKEYRTLEDVVSSTRPRRHSTSFWGDSPKKDKGEVVRSVEAFPSYRSKYELYWESDWSNGRYEKEVTSLPTTSEQQGKSDPNSERKLSGKKEREEGGREHGQPSCEKRQHNNRFLLMSHRNGGFNNEVGKKQIPFVFVFGINHLQFSRCRSKMYTLYLIYIGIF